MLNLSLLDRVASTTILHRLSLHEIDIYVYRRQLAWLGHAGRMSFDRVTRRMLTCWIPSEYGKRFGPTTFGKDRENAMVEAGIPTGKGEWWPLARDRAKWGKLITGMPATRPRRAKALGVHPRNLSGRALSRHHHLQTTATPARPSNLREVLDLI